MSNVTFICTSGKDRSPALVEYFKAVMPQHEYRCAGVNTYFTSKKGTHLINEEDIQWSDVFVFIGEIHRRIVSERFNANVVRQSVLSCYDDIVFERMYKRAKCIVLECGEYSSLMVEGKKTASPIGEDYLTKAELKLKPYLT